MWFSQNSSAMSQLLSDNQDQSRSRRNPFVRGIIQTNTILNLLMFTRHDYTLLAEENTLKIFGWSHSKYYVDCAVRK